MENIDKSFFKKVALKTAPFWLGGVDEVGRGPLAGPVVSALFWWEGDESESFFKLLSLLKTLEVTDSKKLTPKKREKIFEKLSLKVDQLTFDRIQTIELLPSCFFILTEQSHEEIDRINILEASLKAMEEALQKGPLTRQKEGLLLIDGNKTLRHSFAGVRQEAIVKGDSKSLLIGLASIIAKEYRDFLMEGYDRLYPHYGFKQHAGYPTKAHKEALKLYGPTPLHRKSFKGVLSYTDHTPAFT